MQFVVKLLANGILIRFTSFCSIQIKFISEIPGIPLKTKCMLRNVHVQILVSLDRNLFQILKPPSSAIMNISVLAQSTWYEGKRYKV